MFVQKDFQKVEYTLDIFVYIYMYVYIYNIY